MEQTLLDSSRYKIFSLSVDTRFADQYYRGSSDFMIRTPSTYRNIQRIALTSAEVPLVEKMFSTAHGNLNFSVFFDASGSWVDGVIPSGNYNDIQLVDELEEALQVINPNFRVSVDVLTGIITITNTKPFQFSGVSSNLTISNRRSHWGLGYYLGFREKTSQVSQVDASGNHFVAGNTVILIQQTPYYLLQLQCPDYVEQIMHRTDYNGWIPAFAKLVLRDDAYVLQFVDTSDWIRKEYTFLTPVNVSALRVRLVDPYGEPVDMRNMDWSMTFELYEVVNSRTFQHLSMSYDR
jgi:hypothetical protein